MKKIVLLLALISYSAFNAQCAEPIITNFECSPPSYTAIGALTSVVNPFSSGINTSANVGQFIDDGTNPFDNLTFNKGSAIDFTTNNILKFKVYSTKLVPLTAKLEGGTSPAIERNITIDVTGSWVEYTIDFSSESAADHQSLIFFFNFAKTDGTVTDTYYIDDIRWETATTSSDPIVTDFESTKPIHGAYPLDGNTLKLSTVSNHISSGINTSATIGKYKDDGTAGFDGLIFEYGSAIDLSTNNILKIKLYTPTSIQILAKLEGGTMDRELWSPFSIDRGPVNSWIEFTYDFSAYANNNSGGDGNTRIVFFVNAGVTSGTTSDIYYLDDIKWAPKSTWTGAVNTDWSNAGNWTGGVPTSVSQVEIPDLATDPIIKGITGATVDNINTNSVLTIESGGSLKVGGTSSGNITYKVNISDTNWHLVSSPVVGEQYDNDWVTANLIAPGQNSNRGIATYDNGAPDTDTDGTGTADTATGHWRYFQAGGTTTFGSGVGYSLKRTASGNYTFIGTFPTSDMSPSISQSDNNWNLIGNPYPSYIDIAAFISKNGISNDNKLSDAFQAIYVWDSNKLGGAGYSELTTGFIHPGQAFFINSKVINGNASITEAMQSHQTGITFYKNTTPSISLILSNGKTSKKTKINYINGKTEGLDPGFDIGMFNGVSSNFKIYTYLLENNNGISFARQALPNANIDSKIVPIGISHETGGEITFTAEALNIPTNYKVYLEDKINNTVTRLDETNAAYKTTVNSGDTNGRFFLHTKTSSVLSIDSNIINNVSIYNTNNHLKIVGLQEGKASVSLFNMLGKKIMNTNFDASNINTIKLPNLASGIYIVELNTVNGKLNKKIILK